MPLSQNDTPVMVQWIDKHGRLCMLVCKYWVAEISQTQRTTGPIEIRTIDPRLLPEVEFLLSQPGGT